MQVLSKAQLPIFHDGIREADGNNPKGYFELEAVKNIITNNSFLNEAFGKVVKIVAPLTVYVNPDLPYKMIVMRRDMEEILQSQAKMIVKDQSSEREKFRTIYEFHLKKTYRFLNEQEISYLEVDYNKLITSPKSALQPVVEFLDLNVSAEELATVVNPELYRNRNEG